MLALNGELAVVPAEVALVTTIETDPIVLSSGVSTLIWSLVQTVLVAALQ
jgi:hypothetical protein